MQRWKKSGNGKLNVVDKELRIRGSRGDMEVETEDDDNIVFVDDDRWQFTQKVGMHIGYFWCLSEMNELTDECRQHVKGVGVTMDNVRSTTKKNTKKDGKSSLDGAIVSLRRQIQSSQRNAMVHLEMNVLRDTLSQTNSQIIFMKSELYEAKKWVMNA